MATQRRSLASTMDPTPKTYPNPTPSTTTTTMPHPTHIPPPPPPSSTLESISNHFSRLYTNHKILTSLKASNGGGGGCVDTHLQAKAMAVSSHSDTSSATLTKSKSQHARRNTTYNYTQKDDTTKTKVKEKVVKEAIDVEKPSLVKGKIYEIKKPSSEKEWQKIGFHDIKKASALMCRSYEGDELKKASNGGGGRRRRSFGSSSQAELADFFSSSGVKVVSVDMPPFMQIHAVDCARKACDSLEKFTAKTLAQTLKKEFDGAYGPAWHCIVGKSFGSFVTHSVGGFMYFSMDQKLYVLLFKTTVKKVD